MTTHQLRTEASKLERYVFMHRHEPQLQAHLRIIVEWASRIPKMHMRAVKLKRMLVDAKN